MPETWEHRRPVEEEDLVGTLFCPSTPGPHPAVIALGGVGGGLREGGAEALASEGFAALALAYFGVEGLPRELVEIPLEYFEKAIAWLKSQPEIDANRIAVVGNSKGGELALLLGATYPEDVKAVIGYAPSAVVWQGIAFNREAYHGGPRSPWSSRGEPVPFARLARPLPAETVRIVGSYLSRQPIVGRVFYERALKDETAVAAAEIAVEKIDGPLLLISGTADQMWPSTRLSKRVIERLKAHDHPFPYEHLRYEGAGHMITLPNAEPPASWSSRYEVGGTQEANEFANADSWTKVLSFLEKHLKHGSP
ncbi:MAG: dienelactone hydrolase family protein [Actinomycetota bacterium]|nr:dienelactone hydrolase family protein [Actinomycetota bacterium]